MEQQLNVHDKIEYPPMHTAEHILNRTMVELFGCSRAITTHIDKKKSKCDYLLPSSPGAKMLAEVERRVNEVIRRRLPVHIDFLSREEAGKIVDLDKLPVRAGNTVRIVRVGNYDACACIGKHVGNTSEIGRFKIVSYNYSEGKLRLRFTVVDPAAVYLQDVPVDHFFTIASESEGIFRNKGSKFMAFAVPVSSEEEIREKMEWLKKKYFDARHHCYAWRLGVGGAHFRTYDDGEPAGSAGKPILRQITSFGLTNILVAVVRYFGGIPLGTAGLVQAYKHASIDALSHANIVPAVLTDTFLLTFDYQNMDQVLRTLKDMELEYTDRCFENNCSLKVKVRQSLSGVLLHRIGRIASAEMQA